MYIFDDIFNLKQKPSNKWEILSSPEWQWSEKDLSRYTWHPSKCIDGFNIGVSYIVTGSFMPQVWQSQYLDLDASIWTAGHWWNQ